MLSFDPLSHRCCSSGGLLHQDDKERTTSLNRSIEHIDGTQWFAFLTVAGAARYAVSHPFRVVMARERTHISNSLSSADVARDLYHKHGARGFLRGFAVAATVTTLGEASYVYAFEALRGCMPFTSQMTRDAAAAWVADVGNVVLAAPFDVVAARQMTAGCGLASAFPYTSGVRTAQYVMLESGSKGMFAGLSASLLLTPSTALFWCLYNPTKSALYSALRSRSATSEDSRRVSPTHHHHHTGSMARLLNRCFSTDDNVFVNGIAGGLSGAAAAALYNPVLVVAVRLQCGAFTTPYAGTGSKLMHVVRDVMRHEGMRGFLKGMRVNVIMSAVEGVLFTQMYEISKLVCEN
eukprot:PhM_4_TR9420/c0_g1_i1/m.67318/K15121/SLC25A44; solute carrier family 25, member 44